MTRLMAYRSLRCSRPTSFPRRLTFYSHFTTGECTLLRLYGRACGLANGAVRWVCSLSEGYLDDERLMPCTKDWDIYNDKVEWERQGVLKSGNWRITQFNEGFKEIDTYPELLVVPTSITDAVSICHKSEVLQCSGTDASRHVLHRCLKKRPRSDRLDESRLSAGTIVPMERLSLALASQR